MYYMYIVMYCTVLCFGTCTCILYLQYPPIKPVSFSALDPLFRNSGPTLHTAIDLKEDFKFALLVFKVIHVLSCDVHVISLLSHFVYETN